MRDKEEDGYRRERERETETERQRQTERETERGGEQNMYITNSGLKI